MKIPEEYFDGYTIEPCTVEFVSGLRRCYRVRFPTGSPLTTETLWGARRTIRKDAKARYRIDRGVK